MMPDPGRAPPPSPVHPRDEAPPSDEVAKQAFSAELFAKLRKFELHEKEQAEPIKSMSSAIGAYRRGLQMEHEVVRMRAKERHERALKRRRLDDAPVPRAAPADAPENRLRTH